MKDFSTSSEGRPSDRAHRFNHPQLAWASLLIALAPFCATIHAEIIAVHDSFARGYNGTSDNFQVRFGIGNGGSTNGAYIFDNLNLSAADVGKTFVITQTEDSDYNNVVADLINGRSDYVTWELSFGHFGPIALGYTTTEKDFFNPLPAGSNGIDFQGFSLDSINLRIDSVNITPTDFSIDMSILVDPFDPVPEPGSGSLLMLGAGVLWLSRRIRKLR